MGKVIGKILSSGLGSLGAEHSEQAKLAFCRARVQALLAAFASVASQFRNLVDLHAEMVKDFMMKAINSDGVYETKT